MTTFVNAELLNTLLLNSINKFHPFILYFTITMLFVIVAVWSTKLHSTLNCRWDLLYLSQLLRRSYIMSMFFITVTLFMGSWWALQEGSWGGWWNWDASEVFGLLIMIIWVLYLHKTLTSTNLYLIYFWVKLNYLLIPITYLFIQLNFSLISHNFGIKPDQLVDTTQVLQLLFVFFTLFFFKVCTNHLINTYYLSPIHFNFFQKRPTFNIFKFCIYFLVLNTFTYSFIPLFNDFVWKLFYINVFNLGVSIKNVLLTTLILFIILNLNLQFLDYILIIIFALLAYDTMYMYLIFMFTRFALIHQFHSMLPLFLLLTFMATNKILSVWLVLNKPFLITSDLMTYISLHSNWSICSVTLQFGVNQLLNTSYVNTTTSPLTLTTFMETHTFSNYIVGGIFKQNLMSGMFSESFSIGVDDLTILPLTLIFTFSLLLLIILFYRSMLIIF